MCVDAVGLLFAVTLVNSAGLFGALLRFNPENPERSSKRWMHLIGSGQVSALVLGVYSIVTERLVLLRASQSVHRHIFCGPTLLAFHAFGLRALHCSGSFAIMPAICVIFCWLYFVVALPGNYFRQHGLAWWSDRCGWLF